MKLHSTLRARLSLAVTLIILAAILSACAAKPPSVIRGTSEVLKFKEGDVVHVPPGWDRVYGVSPQALEELTRACGERFKSN